MSRKAVMGKPTAKLKRGDKVKVYAKPLTNEDYEGDAQLVKEVYKKWALEGYEYWMVRFKGESSVYSRQIHIKNLI